MTAGKFLSGEQHPRWSGSSNPEMVGKRFGSIEIISSEIRREGKHRKVLAKCHETGIEKWTWLDALRAGRVTSFIRNGVRALPHSAVLGRRYDAIVSRCTNPLHKHYKNYGGRGIQNRFNSRKEFVQWVVENLPHPTYHMQEIDRINNDGHYEPGNLRLASRQEQMRNRRITLKILYQNQLIPLRDFPSPYEYSQTRKLVKQGLTGEQILERHQSMTF